MTKLKSRDGFGAVIDNDDDILKEPRCPFMSEEPWTILLMPEVHAFIQKLDEKITTTEFLVYLKGKIDKNKRQIIVTGYYLPKQQVSSSTVDVLESSVAPQYNGVLHKHPRGVSHFSSTDEEYVNVNHEFSILLEDGEYKEAVVLVKLPCGYHIHQEAIVKLYVQLPEIPEIDELIKEKIKEKHYTIETTAGTRYFRWRRDPETGAWYQEPIKESSEKDNWGWSWYD